jgi:signal transduction histidine kinase
VPGTLCAFSETAHEPSLAQLDMLEVLARQVVELLELQHRTAPLDKAHAELEESNARLAGFAGQVSHDLRSPLTTMLGYLEMVQDDPEMQAADGAADDLKKIEATGHRMLGMLEAVLNYSRVGGAIQPEYVSVGTVTGEALRDLGIVDANVVEVQDLVVYADRGQLRTLLQNLLSNAMNYRSPLRELRVSFGGVSNYHGTSIFVADNGKGIARRTVRESWNRWCGFTETAPGQAWAWRRAAALRRPTAGSSRSQKLLEGEPPWGSASLPGNRTFLLANQHNRGACRPHMVTAPFLDAGN